MSTRTYNRIIWLNWMARLLSLVLAVAITTGSFFIAFAQGDAQGRTTMERLAVAENRLDSLGAADNTLAGDIRGLRGEHNALRARIDSLDQRVAMGQGAIGVIGALFTILQLVQMTTDKRVRRHHSDGVS